MEETSTDLLIMLQMRRYDNHILIRHEVAQTFTTLMLCYLSTMRTYHPAFLSGMLLLNAALVTFGKFSPAECEMSSWSTKISRLINKQCTRTK